MGGTGIGPRIREDNGWGGGFLHPSSRGQALCGGTGMGPRIREDNGWGWIPASVFTGTGSLREQRVGVGMTGGGGFLHPSSRGQAFCGETGMGPRIREDNGWGWIPASVFTGGRLCAGGRGWVPASARTTGGSGFSLPSSLGQASCGGTGMGSRIREDNGWGWILASVVTGGQALRGKNGGGDGSPHPRGQWVGVGMIRRGALG